PVSKNKDVAIEEVYPLSPLQQGLLFHTMREPAAGVYVMQLGWALRGELDVPALQRAWQQVMDRHGALRTAFVVKKRENPLQVVCRHVSMPWSYEDWSDVEGDEQQTRLMSFLEADGNRGFDLSRAPLMRVFLVKLGEQQHQLMWSYHHLLLDGWSVGLVLNEVFSFYEAFHL